ncbi:MAG: YbjQ family protein [Anaerolineae bacterium]|nr:heavy metal-binding domain-containing protein [Anaerolineae bacterium]MDW8298428.1 YbjQ family protein [Anaerolineae bacterium]
MLVTTTPTLEGKTVRKYLGLVSGETILGANIFRDIGAGLRDIFGGRARSYERSLIEAKQSAINQMIEQAKGMGANAVIGVSLDFETVGSNGSMLMVSASGTAVIVE